MRTFSELTSMAKLSFGGNGLGGLLYLQQPVALRGRSGRFASHADNTGNFPPIRMDAEHIGASDSPSLA